MSHALYFPENGFRADVGSLCHKSHVNARMFIYSAVIANLDSDIVRLEMINYVKIASISKGVFYVFHYGKHPGLNVNELFFARTKIKFYGNVVVIKTSHDIAGMRENTGQISRKSLLKVQNIKLELMNFEDTNEYVTLLRKSLPRSKDSIEKMSYYFFGVGAASFVEKHNRSRTKFQRHVVSTHNAYTRCMVKRLVRSADGQNDIFIVKTFFTDLYSTDTELVCVAVNKDEKIFPCDKCNTGKLPSHDDRKNRLLSAVIKKELVKNAVTDDVKKFVQNSDPVDIIIDFELKELFLGEAYIVKTSLSEFKDFEKQPVEMEIACNGFVYNIKRYAIPFFANFKQLTESLRDIRDSLTLRLVEVYNI